MMKWFGFPVLSINLIQIFSFPKNLPVVLFLNRLRNRTWLRKIPRILFLLFSTPQLGHPKLQNLFWFYIIELTFPKCPMILYFSENSLEAIEVSYINCSSLKKLLYESKSGYKWKENIRTIYFNRKKPVFLNKRTSSVKLEEKWKALDFWIFNGSFISWFTVWWDFMRDFSISAIC